MALTIESELGVAASMCAGRPQAIKLATIWAVLNVSEFSAPTQNQIYTYYTCIRVQYIYTHKNITCLSQKMGLPVLYQSRTRPFSQAQRPDFSAEHFQHQILFTGWMWLVMSNYSLLYSTHVLYHS